MRYLALALAVLTPAVASAEEVKEAQRAQLEELRKRASAEIQLIAYNLVDEMVFGWKQDPIFAQPTDVVVAAVTVPVGLGTAMNALLENHLTSVLLKNPTTNVVLTHCPACTAVVVHSGKEGTIVARGVDNPDALARVRQNTTTEHALFIDVEAEGTSLVLRARITKLDDKLSIVWARTISSAASAGSMLRQPDGIKSVEEARKELMDAVEDNWPVTIPLRIGVRLFQVDSNSISVIPPPFIWFQGGVEMSLSQARVWTASLMLGYGYVPTTFDGFMAQVRFQRLLTGPSRSYIRPDIYMFVGASLFAVQGPAAAIFARGNLNSDEVLLAAEGNNEPLQVFSGLHTGFELRMGNRLGLTVFAELLPAHLGTDNFNTLLGIFHSFGTEVGVWF